jgi:hypothetical protein
MQSANGGICLSTCPLRLAPIVLIPGDLTAMRFSDRLTRASYYQALDIPMKISKRNAIAAASDGAFSLRGMVNL